MSVTAETLSSISVVALVTAMMTNDKQESEYILVVGLGITGLSAVRYLSSQGKNIVVVDSRKEAPGLKELQTNFPEVSVFLGGFDETLFMGASRIVVSPGVSMKEGVIQHAIERGVDVIGDIELFAQQVNAPVVAVTGSNGKSTVVSILGEMAKAAKINSVVGGNIGIPALDLISDDVDLYILELSSFQLESLKSLKPVAAAVLNVSPDHMDRYDSYAEYIEAKQHIYQQCGMAVINRDDEQVSLMQAGNQSVAGFTMQVPVRGDYGLRKYDNEMWLCKGDNKLIQQKALKLSGQHNTANALAALALGEAAGLPVVSMLTALTTFYGLPHRTQFVAEKKNIMWVNDSKGTNVGATIAAINGLQVKNKLLLIAGGIAKDADFNPLKLVVKEKVRGVVLIGRDASKIEQALQGEVSIWHAKDMSEAVSVAADKAKFGDTVLLSPACASFDMFNGYEHRGEVFVKAVEGLQ
jgi:UDP-N-acetylmuramoylalanine--D-glutamate ligase